MDITQDPIAPATRRSGTGHRSAGTTAGRWFFRLLGALVLLMGAALAYGGVRLLAVDGSAYYVVAGFVAIVSGVLLALRHMNGVWLFSALSLGTLVWSLAEVGLEGWGLIPRLDWLIVPGLVLLAGYRFAVRELVGMRRTGYIAATAVPSLLSLAAILVPLLNPAAVMLAESSEPFPRPATPFSRGTVDAPDGNIAANHDASSWTAYAGSNLSNHYSPASQITPANVGQLKKAWEFHTGDLPPPGLKTKQYLNENSPLKIGDSVYVCTPTQQVIALDAASGKEKWRFNPRADAKTLNTGGAYCRGVAYYAVPNGVGECATRILWGVTGGRLAAIDAETGKSCSGFGQGGFVDLTKGMGKFTPGYFGTTSAPVVIRGKVIIGQMVRDGQDRRAPSGVVRAYDVVTGKFAWAWDLGRPGVTTEPGPGEEYTPGTPNVWAPISADDQLGLVYLPTGNAAGDFWGGTRTALEEEFTSSLVAVEAATGRVVWHFRTVNHDLWDFDIGPQPNLVDWPVGDGVRPAVIQATKSGQIFVLDRENGKPLMPVVQMPAPKGAEAGDFTAPTQPISPGMPMTVGAPGYIAERLTERDAWGLSPFDQLACRIEFKSNRYQGMWTPPSLSGSIQYPGSHGGLNWGGVSVDLQRGIMVMNTNRLPYIGRLVSREEIDAKGSRSLNQGGPDKRMMPQVGLPVGAVKSPWLSALQQPCIAPPWGHLTGVDLRTRQVIWRRPFGTGYDSGPMGLKTHMKLPTGTPSDGGPLTTAGGVTIIGATLDQFMRGFDTATGRMLWEERLPAGAQAAPISYVHNGKQYVVAVVGGHQRLGTKLGDSVIAWTLP
ncbi:membrane-bound PQQ-dependent dehydrogenase, glucose/quinate/shikimate family [Massilia sp. METH4]|uniref:membrane-bound PQQ-dependent dehydrogenase, glucose/quinate/shikimate family n=1 Tax=Massilia sp. METH4 TaxID=3123041 RepID=UPI0030D3C8F4